MLRRALALTVVSLAIVGCGVSPADSRKVWRSVEATLGADRAGGSEAQALTASFSFDVECARGGEAEFDAGLDVDDETENLLTALFGYRIQYDACQPDENTLDGELVYTATIVAQAQDNGGFLKVETVYRGEVTSTGETNGTCEIDLVGTLDAAAYENPGDEMHAEVDMQYAGTICGNDAEETFSAKADVDIDS